MTFGDVTVPVCGRLHRRRISEWLLQVGDIAFAPERLLVEIGVQ